MVDLLVEEHFFVTLAQDSDDSIKKFSELEVIGQHNAAQIIRARISKIIDALKDVKNGAGVGVLLDRDIWMALAFGRLMAEDGFVQFSLENTFPKTLQYLKQEPESLERFKYLISNRG